MRRGSGSKLHIELDIVRDSHKILGTGTVNGGAPHDFVGWLDLVRFLEDAFDGSDD